MAENTTPKNIVENAPIKPVELAKPAAADEAAAFSHPELEAGAESNRARLAEILAKVNSVETAKAEIKGDTKVKLKADVEYSGIPLKAGSEVAIDKASADYLVANKFAEKL